MNEILYAASRSGWGRNAPFHYWGDDEDAWREHDVSEVIRRRPSAHTLCVDQGNDAPFPDLLRLNDLRDACDASNRQLRYFERLGYGHSYLFASSFLERHLRFHAEAPRRP